MDQPLSIGSTDPSLYIPPTPGSTTAPKQPSGGRSKRGLFIGLIIGLIALLAGGTYAAARLGYITLPIPLPGLTNDIIAKSLDALYNTTASEIKADFSISIESRDKNIPSIFSSSADTNNGALGFNLYGPVLDQIPENFFVTANVRGYNEKTTGTGKADTTVRVKLTADEIAADFDFDVRLLEEKIYAKINALSGFPNIDATAALGQWFTTDLAELDNFAPAVPDADTDKVVTESKQTIAQFLDLAQKHRLFITKKNWGTEVIETVSTRHTSHSLNAKQVVPFFEALIAVRLKEGADVRAAERVAAELKKEVNQTTLENVSKALTIDLWFDKKANLMKKIGVTFLLVPPADTQAYKDKMFALSYSTTILSSGQKKTVETPANAKPLEELFNALRPSTEPIIEDGPLTDDDVSTGSNTNVSTNSNGNINASESGDTDGDGLADAIERDIYRTDPNKRDTDIDGISDFNEVTWCGTDPLKIDTDNDTYEDRDEILSGYDPSGPGQKSLSECRTVVAGQLEVTVIP